MAGTGVGWTHVQPCSASCAGEGPPCAWPAPAAKPVTTTAPVRQSSPTALRTFLVLLVIAPPSVVFDDEHHGELPP
jgi:hypothetical protein